MRSPSLRTLLYTLLSCFFLFSCTRAVDDKTSITISLASKQSINKFSSDLTSLYPLVFYEEAGVATVTDDFAPDPDSSVYPGEFKERCYFVSVGYPEQERNRNYCGEKKTSEGPAVAANLAPTIIDDVTVTPTFLFSQDFRGLVNPSVSSTVTLPDISIGADRTFTVIAVPTNDVSTCQDMLSQPMKKSSMLRPRIVGQVMRDVQVSGNNIDIVVDELNYKTTFDDCIITDTKLNYPNADKAVIEQDNFPFNYMQGYNGESRGFVCQPLVVGLRATSQVTQREAEGALDFDSVASIRKRVLGTDVTTTVTTYNTHSHCVADASGSTSFTFPRNKPAKTRWVRVAESSGSYEYTPVIDSTQITSTAASTFTLVKSGKYVLDHQIPRVLQLDVCYKVSTTIREIKGGSTNSPSGSLNLTVQSPAGLRLYVDGQNCSTDNFTSAIPIAQGARGASFWIKAPSSNFSSGAKLDLKLKYSATPDGTANYPYYPTLTLYTSRNTQKEQLDASGGDNSLFISQVGTLDAYPKRQIPNDGGCYPLTVAVTNELGAVFASNPGYLDFNFFLKNDVAKTFEDFDFVPLRYEPVDIAKDNQTGGYHTWFGNSITSSTPCGGYEMYPVGSGTIPTGTPHTTSDGTFYTLFISTANDGAFGRRRIQFYYGGTSDTTSTGYSTGQVDFELTQPD